MSVEQKIYARENFARQFYQSQGFTAERTSAHMEGIDFSKAVKTVKLEKGTVVQQWVGDSGLGNYFTTVENGSLQNLGINDYGKKTLKQFVLTEDVEVLKSTAADYKGGKGGGTQFFSTELKGKVKEVE